MKGLFIFGTIIAISYSLLPLKAIDSIQLPTVESRLEKAISPTK